LVNAASTELTATTGVVLYCIAGLDKGLGPGITATATVDAVAAEAVQSLAHSREPVTEETVQLPAIAVPIEPVL
jgi:hypothetical protein